MKKNAFSLLEIIITLSIISVLVMISTSGYYGLQKGSRDAKRKADIDIIRNALELYKLNNFRYPKSLDKLTGDKKYLQSIPQDPYSNQEYGYNATAVSTDCNDLIDETSVYCTNYILGAYLERSTTNNCEIAMSCGSKLCNYCTDPYGKK